MGSFNGPSAERTQAIADDLNEMVGNEVEHEEVVEQEVVVDEPTDATPPPAEEAPPPPSTINIGGVEYDAAMAEDINGLVQWASSLTPEQYERVVAALNDPAPSTPTPTPEPEPAPDYSEVDPDTAAILRRQEEELAALKAQLAQQGQVVEQTAAQANAAALEAQRIEFQEAEARVKAEFLAEHGLSEEDYGRLVSTAGQLGITYRNIEQHGLEAGLRLTLNTAFAADTEFQQKAIEARARALAEEQIREQQRQAASALAPQGGTNIPAQVPANLPMSERRQAMKADIEKMLGNI